MNIFFPKCQARFFMPSLLFVMISLFGCSSGQEKPKLSVNSASFYAESDTNQNSAIAVDLVLVYNAELARAIGEMNASKYFEASEQLLLDNPNLIEVWRWELVPGQVVQDFEINQSFGNAYRGYVFANYITPGNHRIRVNPDGEIGVLLLKTDMKNLSDYDYHNLKFANTGGHSQIVIPDNSSLPKNINSSVYTSTVNQFQLGKIKKVSVGENNKKLTDTIDTEPLSLIKKEINKG